MKRFIFTLVTATLFLASSGQFSFAADTTTPQLVDWTLTTSIADISLTDANVTVRFIISDDSEIAVPNLLLKSLSSTQMTSFAVVKELSRSGKLVSYEANAVIKFGQSPRVWEWVLYPLKDSLGNSSTSFGPGGNWVSQISVIDKTFTYDILQCERTVKNWNFGVDRFENSEKRFPGAQEFAIVRLKFQIPIQMLRVEDCASAAFLDKYMKTSSNSNLSSSTTNLANVWANVTAEVADRINLENLNKQAAADKAAADKAAADKAAADKAAARKTTTITCVKGKLVKKVTAVKPQCPSGYKVKK